MPQSGQFSNNDEITAVAAGAASSLLPLLPRHEPMHLSHAASMPIWLRADLGQTALAHVNWSSNWDLLLLLLQTLVAPLHLDVVLAAWRSKAWHLVEVQEEVQEAVA